MYKKHSFLLSLIILLSSMSSFGKASIWQKIKTFRFKKEAIKKACGSKVAVLRIDGSIGSVYGRVLNQIMNIKKDKNVKGILLYIDSGGGAVGSTTTLMLELKKLGKKMPIVTYINNLACSGGYIVSVFSSKIIASPCAEVGSIGAIYSWEKRSNIVRDKGGYKSDIDEGFIKKGEYKLVCSKEGVDKNQRAMISNILDTMYNWIVNEISGIRNLSLKDVDKWANGKSFAAPDALDLGLIDQIGTLSDAIDAMSEMLEDSVGNIKYIDSNGKVIW